MRMPSSKVPVTSPPGSSLRRRDTVLRSAIAVALYGVAPIALADEQSRDASSESLGEIVVTATRRAQTLEDVPYAVSAILPDQLANTGVTDIASLANQVPGLSMNQYGARTAAAVSPAIRSINIGTKTPDTAFRSLEQNPVGVYIGNSPINGYFQLDDVQRIEVLRGPQGTLYGAGALGGALRIIPIDPKLGAWQGSMEVRGGQGAHSSDAAYGASGMINIPMGDTLAFRASARYDHEPGFINLNGLIRRSGNGLYDPVQLANPADPVNSPAVFYSHKDFNDTKSFTGRAALNWQPTERFNAKLGFTYSNVRGDGSPTVNPDFAGGAYPLDPRTTLPAGGPRENFSGTEQPFARDTSLTSLDLSYDMGFATISSTSTYYRSKGKAITDLTYIVGGIPGYVEYYAGTPVNPRFVQVSQFSDDSHTYSQELRLVSNAGGVIDYSVGVFYENQTSKSNWDISNPGSVEYTTALGCTGPYYFGASFPNCLTTMGPNDIGAVQHDTQKFHSTSFFGELTWHFLKGAQITFGARHFSQGFSDSQQYTLYPLFVNFNTSASQPASKSIFKINPSYEYLPGQHVYALWSQGFRRGGATAVPLAGFLAENPSLSRYDSDKTDNYEIGFKGRLANSIRYSFALFDIEWHDPQISGLTPWGNQTVWNAPAARSRGAEFELQAPLGIHGLSTALGGSYSDAKLTKSYVIVADSAGNITGEAGQQLPGSAKFSGTATLNYDRPLAGEYNLSVSLNDTYRGSMYLSTFPAAGTTEIPQVGSMNLVNLSVAVAKGSWRMGVYATNLFDKLAFQSAPFYPGRLNNLANYYMVNSPRKVELRFSYSR